MTKIQFRSSFHYDKTLALLAGKELPLTAEKDLGDFVCDIQEKWNKYNDQLFSYYKTLGLTLPGIWNVYPVHPNGKVTSFSEPTTLLIRENEDEFFAMLVHEICHVFCNLDQNDYIITPVWRDIEKKFSEIDSDDRGHILINVLARAGLRHIFGIEPAEKVIVLEKHYPGLKKAWKIIDAQTSISPDEPFDFLRVLVGK